MISGYAAWLAKSKGREVQLAPSDSKEWLDWENDTLVSFDMLNNNYKFRIKPKDRKVGAPVKNTWLRELQVGESHDFQDTIKVNTARCICYQYGFESGKKFRVSAKNRTITRIK